MSIYTLYVKTHNKTGKKYLGQTKSKDPHKYKGSGIYWNNHCKVHGYDYTTEIIRECQSKSELKEWGIYYSELWNIVESEEWANLKPETGEGGFSSAGWSDQRSKNQSIKMKDRWQNDTYAEYMSQVLTQKWQDPVTKQKRIETMNQAKKTESYRRNLSESKKGSKNPMFGKKHSAEIVEQLKNNASGENSIYFIGYYTTPWGVYPSRNQALIANQSCGISSECLDRWCKNSDKLINGISFAGSKYLKSLGASVIGKTYRDLGFYFTQHFEKS